jgi:hypothetical protein
MYIIIVLAYNSFVTALQAFIGDLIVFTVLAIRGDV